MPGKYTSSEEKARILAWRQEKVPIKEICARSGRAKSTIMKLLASSKGLPVNTVPKHKFGGGRRKKTSNTTDKLIKREVEKNPRLTALELKNMHPKLMENVAVRTIQHRLQKGLGLPIHKAAKKPLLTQRMRKQRIAFAKKYIHWTPAQWKKVMFSDESNFQVFRMGSPMIRRPRSSNRFDPKYTVPTVKHPDSVMAWGAFSGEMGRGGLYFLPKNKKMNGEAYIKVLEEHMLSMFRIHNCEMFMQDSAPCHKSKKVMKFFQDKNINVLDWPGNSPDLNPIENCWQKMKNILKQKKTPNLDTLKVELIKVRCQEMSLEYFQNLSNSMSKRLQMVIKNKGNMTKY